MNYALEAVNNQQDAVDSADGAAEAFNSRECQIVLQARVASGIDGCGPLNCNALRGASNAMRKCAVNLRKSLAEAGIPQSSAINSAAALDNAWTDLIHECDRRAKCQKAQNSPNSGAKGEN